MKKAWVVSNLLAAVFIFSSCNFIGGNQLEDNPRTCLNCGFFKPNPFPQGYDPNSGDFSVSKMIANTGLQGIYPLTKRLFDSSQGLTSSVADACEEPFSDEKWSRAEAAWSETAQAYHQLAAIPLGPIFQGSPRLQDEIYPWPSVNVCGIDLEVVRLNDSEQLYNSGMSFTLKGLSALEYLLFDKSLGTQCNPRNPQHAVAFEWVKKSKVEKIRNRCRLLEPLAADMTGATYRLERSWAPESVNYSKALVDGSVFSGDSEALTALAHALFAIEFVKDQKLGKPLGIHKDCTKADRKCPESVEHSWSGLSLTAAISQLKGLRHVFTGGLGRGFDDLLVQQGHAQVRDSILAAIDQAIQSGEALIPAGPLRDQILNLDVDQCRATTAQQRKVPLCAFFQDVRQISIKMKTEFLSVLSIREPPLHSGDND